MLNRRELFELGAGAAAAAVLGRLGVAQAAPAGAGATPAAIDPMTLVDPELRPIVAMMQKIMGNAPPDFSSEGLKKQRAMSVSYARKPLDAPAIEEKLIPGPKGAPDVRVVVTGAEAGKAKPAVLHIHGGGYVAGSALGEKRNIQDLALEHDCVVVSVDYRLAPETAFPGSLEDNYAALKWMVKNAAELGVDAKRIAVKGESAGGGHAAALAIAARDRGEFPLCLQMLIYPMLDDRTGSTNKVPSHIGRYVWTEEENRFGWSSLLGVAAGSASVPKNSVPARVENLAGLAPAFIGVGAIDLFVSEDVEYARRLLEAGVPTELMVVPGACHGFDMMAPQAKINMVYHLAWNGALQRAFAKT